MLSAMRYSSKEISGFQDMLRDYYGRHGRDLPWRQAETDGTFNPYKILVSEIMLQQTQVPRVIPKYAAFLERFPSLLSLAEAEQGEVLRLWSGLGYNRRARYLHQAAQTIHKEYQGKAPLILNTLTKLPGIGKNTAGAILAYAYNEPVLFVETNIRSVYIHHFFNDRNDVSDAEILEVLRMTLDTKDVRGFYWALMDYGTYLKAHHGNAARKSKHYTRQSAFVGSKRQIRGIVLKLLTEDDRSLAELKQAIDDGRLEGVLADLTKEKLIRNKDERTFSLS